MCTKIWNFLLPATGSHQLRVENLGTPAQKVFIDGEQQPSTYALVFTGPGDSLIEIRNTEPWKHSDEGWTLLVNGFYVEDYNANRRKSGDESLRELRSRPDGAYIISPTFELTANDVQVASQFQFRVGGQLMQVNIAHSESIWQVLLDGVVQSRGSLFVSDGGFESHFAVPVAPGKQLPASMTMSLAYHERESTLASLSFGSRVPSAAMTWHSKDLIWNYALVVNGLQIPTCWTKHLGAVEPQVMPLVVITDEQIDAAAPNAPNGPLSSPEGDIQDVVQGVPISQPLSPVAQGSLPQGVSYDEVSGRYQANIRNRTGKFVFLGEFLSAEEAYQSYLQAMPIHSPDKKIVASLPSYGDQ